MPGHVGVSVVPVLTDGGVSELEAEWDRLSAVAEPANVFTTYGWFRAWDRRLTMEDPNRRPHVLVLRQGSDVVGISPLILRTAARFGLAVRKIEFVGPQGDYHDLVVGRDAAGRIEAVARFLEGTADDWDLVDLSDLREAGGQIPQIIAALSRTDLRYRLTPERLDCPYVLLDGAPAAATTGLSGHARRTLRRRIERATAEGLRVRLVEQPHLEPGLLQALIDLESRKHNSAGPFIGRYPDVFRSLLDILGPRGWLYVALLERRGDPVAFQLGFRCGGALWDYQKAYDRAFSRFAPGTMLVHAILEYGAARGFREYDFLRGEEPYKTVWSAGCHRSFRLLVWSPRWASRVRKFVYSDLKPSAYRLLGRRR
jgi:CelD/BcsL family acetyltransferase involved in cellulose biosynthesis